jgi:hypothetical protein
MSVRVFAAVYRREPALLRARVEAAAGLAERIQEQYVP